MLPSKKDVAARDRAIRDIREVLEADDRIWLDKTKATMNRWLARGDGIAVYQNAAMDSALLGTRKYVSYGSREAQIESETPPQRLPDIGDQINWAYRLEGVYLGGPL